MEAGKYIARILQRVFTRYKLHHLLFWTSYLLFWAFTFQPGANAGLWLTNSAHILVFHALVCYFNNNYLVDKLLLKRQYLYYVLALVLSILFISFPLSVIMHRYLGLNQSLRDTIWSAQFFLVNGMSILLSVAITMALKLLKRWYQEEQSNKTLNKLNVETELKFLKSQINPHFLFNSLNNLYALTLIKSELAPEVVLRLSNILRYVLYETGEGRVPLNKEIQYIRDYIELERIRLGNRVKIDFQTEGITDGREIEPMLFLTFVENSFKHGISTSADEGWVNINIKGEADKSLHFRIANSRKEHSAEKKSEKSQTPGGIGLVNLKKRLDLIYPEKYRLEIKEEPSHYEVDLHIQTQ